MESRSNATLDSRIDGLLACDISARIARARAELEGQMAEAGLDPRDGWTIEEELRDTEAGTRWIFRPVHLRQQDPPALLSSVTLDHGGRAK